MTSFDNEWPDVFLENSDSWEDYLKSVDEWARFVEESSTQMEQDQYEDDQNE